MVNYAELKKKCVVNILDGRKLGRIKDMIFSFPEGRINSFIVGDGKFFGAGEDLIVDLCCVNKIGDDAVLVSLADGRDERSFDDDAE
ncbi:MAG: YlmC/YmxH family sporulation protein [Clostridia bacterium]|nr:YlmC/YmxH family sporulation protein [Clostridia bacterium]